MEKEEAIKILKNFHDKSALFSVRTALETLHPELKESEDKEIREQIVYAINKLNIPGSEKNKLLAWLEKQDEQKSTLRERYKNIAESEWFKKTHEGMSVSDDEKVDNVNMIEPKFNVGDYIERKDGLGCHAKVIYIGKNVYGCEKLICPKNSSLFFELMFENQDEFRISSDFQQKSVEYNEENEHRIKLLEALCEDKLFESVPNSTTYEEMKITIDWLKSLKQRIVWKPSEEQMRALHDLNLTGNISYAGQGQVLINLYNDLKKLKGE